MILPRLLRTSAFQLTLMYVALFAISVLILFGFVYRNTTNYLSEHNDKSIESEIVELRREYRRFGLEDLRQTIGLRGEMLKDAEHLYALARPDYSLLADNLSAWPAGLRACFSFWTLNMPEEDDDEQSANNAMRASAINLPGGYHLLAGAT